MSGLDELIARLEKATGPSYDLDLSIERHVTGDPARTLVLNYTSSIDAALTLVPEGTQWQVRNTGGVFAEVYLGQFWVKFAGATPALALCIAALKARAPNLPEGEK